MLKTKFVKISGGGKSSGTNDQKFGDTTPSDFAFFGVFNTKNAKSDRGSVPELLPLPPP